MLTGQAKKDYQREWMRRKRARSVMYKDKNKQREAGKERARRYRAKNKGENITETKTKGQLYLIHCKGFPYYKIGRTEGDTKNRLSALQISLPFELVLIKSVKVRDIYQAERYLHELYKDKCVRGEWFNFTDVELEDVIAKYDHVLLFYRMIA